MVSTNDISPVKTSERYVILDALRGFALLGICMANFPEFSLYTFLSPEAAAAMPTAVADTITRYLLYILVDGKFYTLFSLLFGIGFSIIIRNAERKGANGFRIFYRRMGMLLLFGFLHLMFIWSGDILMLYALLGMLLPLFRRASDKNGWRMRNDSYQLGTPVHSFARYLLCKIWHQRSQLCLLAARCGGLWHGIPVSCARGLRPDAGVHHWEPLFQSLGIVPYRLLHRQESHLCRFGRQKGSVGESISLGLDAGSALFAPLCLEQHERTSFREYPAQRVLFHQRLSARLRVCRRLVPPLPKMERRKYMEMAGCSGTDGIDELHRAIRHWYVPVLWHRLGMGEHHRTVAYGSNCAGGLPVSGAVQPLVAFRLQIRSVGMDMADADIREMVRDKIEFCSI